MGARQTRLRVEDLGVRVGAMLDRIKRALGVTTDAELADLLAREAPGLKYRPGVVAQWRARESLPLAALVVASRTLQAHGRPVLLERLLGLPVVPTFRDARGESAWYEVAAGGLVRHHYQGDVNGPAMLGAVRGLLADPDRARPLRKVTLFAPGTRLVATRADLEAVAAFYRAALPAEPGARVAAVGAGTDATVRRFVRARAGEALGFRAFPTAGQAETWVLLGGEP